jgi:glutamyl-tRNA synthetase
MKDLILKWALKNAVDHNGQAVVGAVISKVIGENPEARKDMKKLVEEIKITVEEINKLDQAEQLAKLEKFAPELLEKKVIQQGLPELPDTKEGKVVMMFPPEPSKYATIGHAKASTINFYYATKYKGKFIIRFEDTNVNKIKKEYYDHMLEDLKWLGIKWDKVDYISKHIPKMYKAAEKLIKTGNAYMCKCPIETVHELRGKGEACLCRENPKKENMGLWKKMLENQFKKGEYSLRAKIDMQHKNAAMRDPAIMRTVIGTHPIVGDNYLVWPTYDLATAIMDGIEKITHRLRSKEFEMRAEIQQWIQNKLGIRSPYITEFARFNLEGVPASGRVIREKLASGELKGWDDPRIPTLISLRKRGFKPEAIRNFAINTGLSKHESILTWDVLEAENRKVIEPIAKRYFMVQDYVKMIVRHVPKKYKTEIKLHPDKLKMGTKKYSFPGDEVHVLVNKRDMLEKKQNDELRLMDLMNIKLDVIGSEEVIAEFTGKEMRHGPKIIHWVDPREAIDIEILMANGEIFYGLAEKAADKINVDDVIQFVRFGFCRLDEKGEEVLKFRFTHT